MTKRSRPGYHGKIKLVFRVANSFAEAEQFDRDDIAAMEAARRKRVKRARPPTPNRRRRKE